LTPDGWFLFFTSALAINLSPGPDLVYILSRTLRQGRRAGFASAVGVCTGACAHVVAASVGVSALFALSDTVFQAAKLAGAAYLLYLGLCGLASAGRASQAEAGAPSDEPTLWTVFRQGALIDLLNPKVSMFFLAYLPQFVDRAAPHAQAKLLGLGFLVIGVAVVVEFTIVLAAARAAAMLAHPSSRRLLSGASGAILIAMALQLAMAQR
jgi:threonine/homoserine/homoserine lactone efflux protein